VESPNLSLRILIIGGSGFVSGTLARIALARGCSVTVVTRGQRSVPPGVEVVTVDRNERDQFEKKITALGLDWDLVVDAIAYQAEDAMQDLRVFSGLAKRLVLISTDFVYDPLLRKNPQSEQDAAYLTDGYGGRKREAELILEQAEKDALPWTILRPSHIYGPGSLFGCLPLHGRDPELITHLLAERPLQLVGGGDFLQHPIFAPDLAETILEVATAPKAAGRIFNVAGPEVLKSSGYYRELGSLLDRDITIEEVPLAGYLAAHPDKAPFCCNRVYDLSALRDAGIKLPSTSLRSGLAQQLESILGASNT